MNIRYELRCTFARKPSPLQGAVDPQFRQLLLNAVLSQPRTKVAEVNVIEVLILVEAGEDNLLHASDRVFMNLQTLGADFFHHALHRRVDTADRVMALFQVRLQDAMTSPGYCVHHAVGADRDDSIHGIEGDLDFSQLARCVCDHRLDDVADKRPILHASRA